MDFSNIPIGAIVATLSVILLSIFFTRWVFRVDAIENNLIELNKEAKKQTRLLSEMAEKQGVLKSVIEEIKREMKN